jgi:NADPH:quinone reductase-like Zn-dependent oxidoreductase
MRAYRLTGSKGPYALTPSETPDPRPGPGEVLVRLRASSLNHRDLQIRNGIHLRPAREGIVPLSDGAGEVVAVGERVVGLRAGDRVMGTFFERWSGGKLTPEKAVGALGGDVDGALSDLRLFQPEGLVPIPAHLSFEEAATLPCAAVTAWAALTGGRFPLQPGDTVLVQGTGGVSVFALQLARAFGARVIATTSTAAKAERLRALGADEVILYTAHADWDRKVREATGGRGVDLAIDVGGSSTLAKTVRTLALQGHAALIGFMAHGEPIPPTILAEPFTLHRVGVGSRTDFEEMNRTIAQHRLRPVVDRVFPFAEAEAAYRWLAEARHFGKVVIAH